MTKKRIGISIVVVVLFFAGLAYHFVFGYVELTTINNEITVLTRKSAFSQIGANVVVYEDAQRTIVVDTQLSPFASSTRSKIDALTTKPLATVLITHWHPDHSGGISAFSSDTEVIAHENVRRRLSVPQEGFGLTKPGSHHEFAARSADGLPNRTVVDRLDLQTESTAVNVIHYPEAHTDGDLVVIFQSSQVAVIGDLVWPNSFPYVDVHNGGSVAGLESALQALLAESKSGYRFIPGHGETLTFDDVAAYLDMVRRTRRWVETQLDEGETVDQIAASNLPDEWDKWSNSLVPSSVWVKMIHDSRRVSAAAKQ